MQKTSASENKSSKGMEQALTKINPTTMAVKKAALFVAKTVAKEGKSVRESEIQRG